MRMCIKFFIVLLLLESCSSSLKEIQYLSNNDIYSIEYEQASDYRLKVGDNIYVQILGNNPLVVNNYNRGNNLMYSQESINLFSYTIDGDGNISLPLLGKMKIVDLNIDEAKDIINNKAIELYRTPSVIVKLVNKGVTILGEVNRPGRYMIYKDKLNILEALGLAGDLSDYGNRRKVKLIREVDGVKKVVNINITDLNIINSQYFTIYPNDVLYVPPRNRVYGTKTLSFTGIFGTSLSVISTVISIILLIR